MDQRPYEPPLDRLRRWRRDLNRRHRRALVTAFSTRLTPSMFRRSATLRLRLRPGELELLEAIGRRDGIAVGTLGWAVLSEWLAGTENPRMAPGLSLTTHGITQADAEHLHRLVHESVGGWWGPRLSSERRRLVGERAEALAPLSLETPPGWFDRRFSAPDDVA